MPPTYVIQVYSRTTTGQHDKTRQLLFNKINRNDRMALLSMAVLVKWRGQSQRPLRTPAKKTFEVDFLSPPWPGERTLLARIKSILKLLPVVAKGKRIEKKTGEWRSKCASSTKHVKSHSLHRRR